MLFLLPLILFITLSLRIIYDLHLHPLSKFPGPWYTSTVSLLLALISLSGYEPSWLLSLVKKYGTKRPIRIAPNMLLFPRSSALKDIYWNPKLNTKGPFYGSGVMGPVNMFTTLDGEKHKALKKVLYGPQWSMGTLKKEWEGRFDGQITLFVEKLGERAIAGEVVPLGDRVAEFAADIMTLVTFNKTWGFVENSRDERNLLHSWRHGLIAFGFSTRFRFYRDVILKSPLQAFFLPSVKNKDGMGYLMGEADRQVTQREKEMSDFAQNSNSTKDLLQHTLEAKLNNHPLTPLQKRAHITFIIMAGADTTGNALGNILRFLLLNPPALHRAHSEITQATSSNLLSTPILYSESMEHLPFIGACIRESLRLQPTAPNLYTRLTPPEGIYIDDSWVPGGVEVLCNSTVAQRDAELYAPDPEVWRPERWLVSRETTHKFESASFVFGMGYRVCIGKDIALMELWKLIPELIRWFDMELVEEGRYIVVGGIAYNKDFLVKLRSRE